MTGRGYRRAGGGWVSGPAMLVAPLPWLVPEAPRTEPDRSYLTGVDVYAQGPGDSGDALRIKIHDASGSNGAPGGTPLAAVTVAASDDKTYQWPYRVRGVPSP